MPPSTVARLACGLACWSACFAGVQEAAIPEPTALGPADAPVEIVEYSDFQCPYSRKAWKTLRVVADRYPGKVRWVFKSFPLPFHPQAPLAHEAALAAGEWGRF